MNGPAGAMTVVEPRGVELCTDGSMVPVSSAVGGGGVLRDRGRKISVFVVSFGVGEVFMAEVRALYEGLRHV